MAGGAHLDRQVFAERGTCHELVTATAAHFDFTVVRMNVGFHWGTTARLVAVKKGRA